MVVAHQSGPAGEFFNMTWPGLCGSFQGLAPGRFAVAINQAPMRRHRAGYAGDWLRNRVAVKAGRGMPPAHLLRQVLEIAPDYAAAKKQLSETHLAVPAIFILSGTQRGNVCVANHFETRLDGNGHGWRPRPIDSRGRVAAARALTDTDFADDFTWYQPPIANAHSRLAFNANAATGELALMGTDGAKPATHVFRLPGG
jgi:hypothetical protein